MTMSVQSPVIVSSISSAHHHQETYQQLPDTSHNQSAKHTNRHSPAEVYSRQTSWEYPLPKHRTGNIYIHLRKSLLEIVNKFKTLFGIYSRTFPIY